jgi:hypothetical protein
MKIKIGKEIPIEKQQKFQDAEKRLEQIELKISKFTSKKKIRLVSTSDRWVSNNNQCILKID